MEKNANTSDQASDTHGVLYLFEFKLAEPYHRYNPHKNKDVSTKKTNNYLLLSLPFRYCI